MSLVSWVAAKLRENGYGAQEVGAGGVLIDRSRWHDEVLIYVCEDLDAPFELADLSAVFTQHPGCRAIVVFRRPIGMDVVETASHHDTLVAGFAHLLQALGTASSFAGTFRPDESYLYRRLVHGPRVADLTRVGTRAWRIDRTGDFASLHIITHDRYEFPVNDLWDLLDQHPGLHPDAFVITNPNSRGLSATVVRASEEVGVDVYLLNDFFGRLAAP